MKKHILIILVDKRKKSAVNVQKILTEWGECLKSWIFRGKGNTLKNGGKKCIKYLLVQARFFSLQSG